MIKVGHRTRLQRWGYVFVLPFILVFVIFQLWPTLYTFVLSFSNLKGLKADFQFAGLANFKKLIKDVYFWGSIGNTFMISFVSFVFQLGVSLLLAIWLSDVYLNIKGRKVFRAIVYMPNLLTAVSVSLLFRSLFLYPTGPLSQALFDMGLHQDIERDGEIIREAVNLFRNVAFTRGLVSYIYWFMWYGYILIILMAGITSIPQSLYESALVDGANGRQTAWYITLPLLRPIILYVFLICMIGGINVFDIPALLTEMRGAPDFKVRTTIMYLYNVAFSGSNDYSYGAAIAVGLFIITIMLALIIFFFLQDKSELEKKKRGR
ncbi:cytochrome c biogenesis protein [Spirochaetia bacterium]|nr:cytochrome c biogenesis protein [Spirochaetia bacterium]